MTDILLNHEQRLQLSIIAKFTERPDSIPEDVWQAYLDQRKAGIDIKYLGALIDACDNNLINELGLCYDRIF